MRSRLVALRPCDVVRGRVGWAPWSALVMRRVVALSAKTAPLAGADGFVSPWHWWFCPLVVCGAVSLGVRAGP